MAVTKGISTDKILDSLPEDESVSLDDAPSEKLYHPNLSSGKIKSTSAMELRQDINSDIGNSDARFKIGPGWDLSLKQMVDLQMPDIEKIENLRFIQLKKGSVIFNEVKCTRCWLRGTDDCPHGIEDGKTHANGYCTDHAKMWIIKHKLMGQPSGLKMLRDTNTLNMIETLEYYVAKLNRLKEQNRITKTELLILDRVIMMQKQIGERLDKAVQQAEGVTVNMNRTLTVGDVAAKLLDLKKEDEKVIDVEPERKEEGDKVE